MTKDNPKTIHAWCMYDWANSVYSLTITTAVFPEYFLAVTKNSAVANKVNFLGWEINNAVLYSYALSFVFLTAAIISPLLSGIADNAGNKKSFMRIFCYLGSIACMGLYWFEGQNLVWGILCFVLAGLGYSGSIVFYNAFLPEIASEEQTDKISAKGFAYGYVGSVILLVFNIVMLLRPDWFGISTNSGIAARISFLSVGLWWFGFSHITFHNLIEVKKEVSGNISFLLSGFRKIGQVLVEIKNQKYLRRFLIGFGLYNMGVQTVMYMATIFGKDQLNLKTSSLIVVILIIQLIAIGGAHIFAQISHKVGNSLSLIVLVGIWILVCICAYYVDSANQFYLLACLVGLVMGGVQSMSRSTYAKLIPKSSMDHASYFSFYDVLDKTSTFLGTFSFGFITQLSGGMRNSTLALILFFLLSLIFLWQIPSKIFKTDRL
jgi:UMF1 family MFS transporter